MIDWRRRPGENTLLDMFESGARRHPDRPFGAHGEQRLTWGEMRAAVHAFAGQLNPGTVALYLPNSFSWLIAFLAAQHAGARPALINAALPEAMTNRILDALAPDQIVTAGQVDLVRGEIVLPVGETPRGAASPCAVLNDCAGIFFTGGTTGAPKRITYTHEMMVSAVERMMWGWRMADAEVHLSIAPFTHIYGFNMGVGVALACGATNVIPEAFSPEGALDLMEAHGVTVLGGGPPAIYQAILSAPSLPDRDLSALRCCPGGGAPFPLDTHARWKAATGLKIYEGYGMTEIAPISINSEEAGEQPGAAGKPPPDTAFDIVDLTTGAPVGPGETGEIRARGPHMMAGYDANPDETAIAMRDGWVMTGDIGRIDADGFLLITDRKKDVIITKGYNVFPRDVEEVLASADGVANACIVGAPDERSGERVIAFVAGDTTVEALDALCQAELASYMVPAEYRIEDALPLTPAGKIDRLALRAMAARK